MEILIYIYMAVTGIIGLITPKHWFYPSNIYKKTRLSDFGSWFVSILLWIYLLPLCFMNCFKYLMIK